MNKKINIDRYIETFYFKLSDNEGFVNVAEFNIAFALTRYYNSKLPTARQGNQDIIVRLKGSKDYQYDSSFYDTLVDKEKYAITKEVAFFSRMRAMLPSFTLLIDENTEIKIDAFATIYDNGYCSISHIYNCDGINYNNNFEHSIEYWEDIKGIRLNKNLLEILNLENIDMPETLEFIDISIEDFMLASENGNKFWHNILVVKAVLAEFFKKDISDYTSSSCGQIYRYYQLSTEKATDDTIDITRRAIEQKDDHFIFNSKMCDSLIDITLYKNYKLLLTPNYLVSFREKDEPLYQDVLVPFFLVVDHCFLQKVKSLVALETFKEFEQQAKFSTSSLNELFNLKNDFSSIIKKDIIYDCSFIHLETTAETFWNCITKKYIEELETVYNRLQNEIEYKEKRIREHNQRKFDVKIQIVALLLTIPSISTIVDIMYEINWKNPIYFPIGQAKLLWVLITTILIYLFLKPRNKNNKNIR